MAKVEIARKVAPVGSDKHDKEWMNDGEVCRDCERK